MRVAAGLSAACAVLESGAVWCWGRLDRVVRPVPEPVAGLPSAAVDAVVGWRVACALVAGGEVWCWGDGGRATPAGISGAAAIALAGELACAVLRDGSVTCASPPSGAVALSGSHAQACAVLADGEVSCWGTEPFGPPERFGAEAPFGPAPFASGATAVAVGDGFACGRVVWDYGCGTSAAPGDECS